MEILEAINPVESYLCDMASMKWNPIATTFELLPACNMDCKMCYVRMSMKEMQKRGKMMDADEIKAVIQTVLSELGIETPTAKEKGKIMKELMPRVKGKADGKEVNQILASMMK